MTKAKFKKYNLGAIMRKAWVDFQQGDYETFGDSLRAAWQWAKSNDADYVRAQWQAMTAEAQTNMIKANIKKAAHDEIKRSAENQVDEVFLRIAYEYTWADLDQYLSDAYIKVREALDGYHLDKLNAKRNANGKCNLSLVTVVTRAGLYAVKAVARHEEKHVKARLQTVADKDGNEYSYIDTMATSHKDDTERSALIRVGLSELRAQLDDVDRIIIEAKRDGYTLKEIAQIVGLSHVAIHKRVKKIRAIAEELGLVAA